MLMIKSNMASQCVLQTLWRCNKVVVTLSFFDLEVFASLLLCGEWSGAGSARNIKHNQGNRFVLVTAPFHESRLNWIHDPAPPPSRRLESTDTVPRSDSSANSSVTIPRNALVPIPSDSLHNSNVSDSSVPHPNNSVRSYPKHVTKHKKSENEVSAIATRGSSAAPLSPAPPKKRRIRRRRQARRAANRNSGDVSAAPLTPDARWANQRAAGPAGATQTQPEDSDPTSTRRTAVYPPSRIVGDSSANHRSSWAWSPVEFQAYINRPFQTSSRRILQLEPFE